MVNHVREMTVKMSCGYCEYGLFEHLMFLFYVARDGSKQLPVLLTVECSMYLTLAWRSSGENASLFRAFPLYSCYDAPSPLTYVRSHQPSLTPAGVLSFHPYPVTSFFQSPGELLLRCFFSLCKVLPLSSTL